MQEVGGSIPPSSTRVEKAPLLRPLSKTKKNDNKKISVPFV